MARLGAVLLVSAFAGAGAAATALSGGDPPTTVTVTTESTVTVTGRYRGRTARGWAVRYRHRGRQLQQVHARLRQRWRPTVRYAIRLAAAATGVPYTELAAVAWCESRYDVFARNGRYAGLFQLGWQPFGMSPFDPVANALSAALTVRHDGSWRQWECQP